jgi:NAD(P)-dependent dehydrogenase (short-subunit alcohol dehydrogenase family)
MTGRLEGKICIITGTGGAIGSASALLFSREGARVVGCDVNPETAPLVLGKVNAEGGEMISLHPCDLTDRADCDRLIQFALSRFGRIDVLFNNASRPHYGWMSEPSDDHWFRTIDEELHIVYLLCKAAWPALCASSGTIVNMASTSGLTTYRMLAGIAHSAAKGAVTSMTRHLAMEGRKHGVRANSLSPGVIETPSTIARSKDPEWASAMTGRIMRGSLGKPEEIAAVALFLASDESSFINAADIVVDGGITAWG